MERWIIIDIACTIIAILVSALVWSRYGRRIGGMVLLFQLLLIGLGRIWIDLGLASVLVGVPLWLRDSRRTRVICAALLLLFQLMLLVPMFMVSLHAVQAAARQTEDPKKDYLTAHWEGARAMHHLLETGMVQPAILYSIALAILVFIPYQKKKEESQQPPACDAETRAHEE